MISSKCLLKSLFVCILGLMCLIDTNSRRVNSRHLLRIHRQDPIVGRSCWISAFKLGECRSFFECSDVIIPGVDPDRRICKWVSGAPIVCCARKNHTSRSVSTEKHQKPYSQRKENPKEETILPSEPDSLDYSCGYPYGLPAIYAYDVAGKHDIYYLNRTAEKLRKKGFEVIVEEMFSDALRKFTYKNSSFSDTMYFHKIDGVSPVGGSPAIRERSYYMDLRSPVKIVKNLIFSTLGYLARKALLGETSGEKTKWYCDGVLINRQWVLTAAHCFAESGVSLNTVRLGDMNWNKTSADQPENNPENFEIQNIHIYPKFKASSRYHDLALIQLDRPIAQMQHSMNPICLPWGSEATKCLVGKTLTLTGWGANSYQPIGGSKSVQLQEVDLTVFNSSKCAASYSKLRDYLTKWSHGMQQNTTLCAGSRQGGRDACRGDSGAPLVYQNDHNQFVVGGIVSTGFGCGLKEYPGIYIPLNNPEYLAWIKDVAFDVS